MSKSSLNAVGAAAQAAQHSVKPAVTLPTRSDPALLNRDPGATSHIYSFPNRLSRLTLPPPRRFLENLSRHAGKRLRATTPEISARLVSAPVMLADHFTQVAGDPLAT